MVAGKYRKERAYKGGCPVVYRHVRLGNGEWIRKRVNREKVYTRSYPVQVLAFSYGSILG